ncbi:hypothetical protein ENH_00030970, partial [Eimeria necatrix]
MEGVEVSTGEKAPPVKHQKVIARGVPRVSRYLLLLLYSLYSFVGAP